MMQIDKRYQAIYQAVRRIPAGFVMSYGEVASMAGLPGRARMVGRALRQSPASLALPWHRVLRANGELAFAVGSRQRAEQIRRLNDEGIAVLKGRINMRRYGWQRDADRWLWGPDG